MNDFEKELSFKKQFSILFSNCLTTNQYNLLTISYVQLNDDDKIYFSDSILNTILNSYKENVINNHLMESTELTIHFLNHSSILDYCNLGIIQHILEDLFHFCISKSPTVNHFKYDLYMYFVDKILCLFNSSLSKDLIKSHILSYYCYPQYNYNYLLKKIIPIILLSSYKDMLICLFNYANLRKSHKVCLLIIQYFLKKQKEYEFIQLFLSNSKDTTSIYIQEINNYTNIFSSIHFCNDEIQLILDYLF